MLSKMCVLLAGQGVDFAELRVCEDDFRRLESELNKITRADSPGFAVTVHFSGVSLRVTA